MKFNIVVLCPTNPDTMGPFIQIQRDLIQKATRYAESKGIGVITMWSKWQPPDSRKPSCHAERALHIAGIRNKMVADLMLAKINPDCVIWMDLDVIKYPEDLFVKLYEVSRKHNAVTAPMVFLDKMTGRWYDTAGFINRGERASLHWPYYRQAGDLGLLDNEDKIPLYQVDGSVGCVYCVPYKVYQIGAKHLFCGEKFTEHYSVCQDARTLGMKLLVREDVAVHHAFLSDYGVEFH
jgi:hypothetical protein